MAETKAWGVQVGHDLFVANRQAFHAAGLDADGDKDTLRDLGLYEIFGDVP